MLYSLILEPESRVAEVTWLLARSLRYCSRVRVAMAMNLGDLCTAFSALMADTKIICKSDCQYLWATDR